MGMSSSQVSAREAPEIIARCLTAAGGERRSICALVRSLNSRAAWVCDGFARVRAASAGTLIDSAVESLDALTARAGCGSRIAASEALGARVVCHAPSRAKKPEQTPSVVRAGIHAAVSRRAAQALHGTAPFTTLARAQAAGELRIDGVPLQRLELLTRRVDHALRAALRCWICAVERKGVTHGKAAFVCLVAGLIAHGGAAVAAASASSARRRRRRAGARPRRARPCRAARRSRAAARSAPPVAARVLRRLARARCERGARRETEYEHQRRSPAAHRRSPWAPRGCST